GADIRSVGYGVSDNGTTVGYTETNSHDTAALWQPNGSLGTIPTGLVAQSTARAITSDASTIVGFTQDANTSLTSAFVYRIGNPGIQTLGSIGGLYTDATAISANGSVVAGTDQLGSNTHAVTWSGTNWGTETDLGVLAVNDDSNATGINATGTIVVGIDTLTGVAQTGFYWKNGTMTPLTFAGLAFTKANAISADGSVIVGGAVNTLAAIGTHAVSWSGPTYSIQTDLGTLGGTNAEAYAVNADGSIIVGSASIATNYTHAFRYAGGTMSDLNTLLSVAGVNMGSIVLVSATGISANGKYIVANDEIANIGYLVYYDHGVGGLTTQAAQQSSIDQLGRTRQALAVQQDAYSGLMIGDLDGFKNVSQLGAFGLLGSAVGGLRGRGALGDGFVITGGLSGGTGDYDALAYHGLLGAVALRYDFGTFNGIVPFAQLGASFGQLDGLTFRRSYLNGAGTTTGVGKTSGTVASLFARLGAYSNLASGDQISGSVEIGERWLSTDAYSEDTTNNPFPVSVAAGTDRQTVAKVNASVTHPFTPDLDLTLRGAIGTTVIGSSGLSVVTSGFGTLTTKTDHAVWGEVGARLGWKVTDRTTFDLYATGIAGKDVGTAAHVGVGLRVAF
ncbi:MAG: hypothetical protein P4L98_18655, partial [Ancalomicrobiaceae bacterium]|nr:hypothetical protein [Ancalomicrobiaceae bacterium]